MGSISVAVEWPGVIRRSQAVTRPRVQLVAGRYRAEQLLGEGGSAVVYRAVDQATGRPLALKQLRPKASCTRWIWLGFRREFHSLVTLRHPNIVEVHDFGVDPRGAFYTMELLDVAALQVPRLEPRRCCEVLRDVASALAFLHGRRLVHGDISRKNIGLSAAGVAKLLDFGLLATIGDVGSGRGTMPYIAPEVARRSPLDHRADLYSLGALGYVLLTGCHAYPAQTPDELERRWAGRPLPPARLDPNVPRELSDLLVSMLSVDPLGRPASAAEVIDRLQALCGPRGGGRRSRRAAPVFVGNASLVGRQREMGTFRTALKRVRERKGGTAVVQAPCGMGKSRLLRELAVEAKLGAVQVLSVSCESGARRPYGVIYGLLHQLLRGTTAGPLTAAGKADGALRALGRWAGLRARDPDPAQHRLELQRRLAERILAESEQQPLLLLVDDLQHSDEASLAVLASVAYHAPARPLLLVCALGTDERPPSPDALVQLQRHARPMPLAGLQADEVQQLVREIFGEVEHVERLARWVHDAGGGSPLRCIELARHLVAQGKVRHQDGVWRIPGSLSSAALPHGVVTAMAERVTALSLEAQQMAEILAIHGGELSLELCVALSTEQGEEATFDALHELVTNEILVGTRDRMRFRHDGIREALLAGLSDGRRRNLHRWVGELLDGRRPPSGDNDEAIGWHLLRGGVELRGARLLCAAGLRHFEAQSFADAVGPLEAALEVFERHRVEPRLRCEIRQHLVRAGVVCDREVALRHGGPVLEELHHHAGLGLAVRLRRPLGRTMAFLVALLCAWVRWLLSGGRRGPPPVVALTHYISMVCYVTALRAMSYDVEAARAMPAWLDPLPSIVTGIRTGKWFCRNLGLMLVGYWDEASDLAERYLAKGRAIRRMGVRPIDLQLGLGAMRYTLAFVTSHRAGPKCLDHLQRLEQAGMPFLEVSGLVGRLLHHRLRGEETQARALEEEAKVLMVQAGSMWLWESVLTWVSAVGHGLTRNLPALRQSIDRLEALVARGVKAEPVLELIRGMYRQERGELDSARRGLDELAHGRACDHNPLLGQAAYGALARTLLLQGELQAAMEAARRGAALGRKAGVIHFQVLNACVLSLAQARAGEGRRAARRLRRLLHATPPNPLLHGTLHEHAALVAWHTGDRQRARHHLEQTAHWFRGTRNAALVARVEKLAATIDPHLSLP